MKKIYSQESQKLLQELTGKNKGINVTVGMLKQGKRVFDAWNSDYQEISPDQAYDIGSITKLFTTSLLAKNVSEGKIDLETNLNAYISGLPDHFYPTIKQLATHTSGYSAELPYTKLQTVKMLANMNKEHGLLHVNPFHGTLDEKKMLEVLRNETIRPKEYKFAYNNFAIGVLGYILGQQSHLLPYDAINDYVKNDLSLLETGIDRAVQMPGHDKKQQPTKNWQWDKNDIIASAGSVVSTASDLLKFGQAHLMNEPSYLALCHDQYTNGNKEWNMGLGWRIDKQESSVHWHDGNAGGFSCILMLDMKQKQAIVIMTNYALLHLKGIGMSLLNDCYRLALDEVASYAI